MANSMANSDDEGRIDGSGCNVGIGIDDRRKEVKSDGCGGLEGFTNDNRTLQKHVKSDDDEVNKVDFKPLLRKVSTKILSPNYFWRKPSKATQKIIKEVGTEILDFAIDVWGQLRKPEPEREAEEKRTEAADDCSADGAEDRRTPSPSNPFSTGW